jgi:hypothetical protein
MQSDRVNTAPPPPKTGLCLPALHTSARPYTHGLQVAQTGAVGADFHQGRGDARYSAVLYKGLDSGRLMPPEVNPPFYGQCSAVHALLSVRCWRGTC